MSDKSSQPLLFLVINKLAHFEVCPKRSKLETFKLTKEFIIGTGGGFMAKGNRLHYLYSKPDKGFDRLKVKVKLSILTDKGKYKKQIPSTNIIVIGRYDDLRIIRDAATNKKYTSLIEVKTTSMKYMWSGELRAAIRQLQLYMWLYKELLEHIGYPLWKRSYVEIYSQRDGSLMRLIPVEYDPNIEEWIKHVVESYKGLRPVTIPSYKICKRCPINVKSVCSWYAIRRDYYGKLQAIQK